MVLRYTFKIFFSVVIFTFVLLTLWAVSDSPYVRVMSTHIPTYWTQSSKEVSKKAEAIFDRVNSASTESQRAWDIEQTSDALAPHNANKSAFPPKETEIVRQEKTSANVFPYVENFKKHTTGIYNRGRTNPAEIDDHRDLSNAKSLSDIHVVNGEKNVTKVVENVREKKIPQSNPEKTKVIVT